MFEFAKCPKLKTELLPDLFTFRLAFVTSETSQTCSAEIEFDCGPIFVLSTGPKFLEPGETSTQGRRQEEEPLKVRFRREKVGRSTSEGRKKAVEILFQVC